MIVEDLGAPSSGASPGVSASADVDADHPAPEARWSFRFRGGSARAGRVAPAVPLAALTEATAFGARGGSALRRILTLAIAIAFGVSAWDAIGRLALLDQAWFVRGSLAAVIGMLAAAVVGTASASSAGRARFRVGLRRFGVAAPHLGAELRAIANGVMWFVLGVLAVAFAAPAFVPLPGGPVLWAGALGLGLGSLTSRLHRSTQAHDATRTFNLVAMLIFAGSVASMGATSTGEWWRHNFSTLGTSDDLAAACFNVAVVLSGSAMAVMARELTAGVAARTSPRRGGVAAMRVLIAALGGCLVGVGLVPIDTDTELHNVFALGVAVCFGLLALGVQLWARRIPRAFVVVSYAFVAVAGGTMFAYDRAGLFTLTVFEIVAFTLVFAWLILLVAATAGATRGPAAGPVATAGSVSGVGLRLEQRPIRVDARALAHPLTALPPMPGSPSFAAAHPIAPSVRRRHRSVRPAGPGARGPSAAQGARGAGSPGRRGPSRAGGGRRGRAGARGGRRDAGAAGGPPGLG